MARKGFFVLMGLGLLSMSFAQGNRQAEADSIEQGAYPLRTMQHNAFKPGEKLAYVVHYGFVNAGVAIVELKESDRQIQGRKIWHAVGKGYSLGAFSAFYKVDDKYESYFDAQGVFPWVFRRSVSEGGFEFKQDYIYNQSRREVTTQE